MNHIEIAAEIATLRERMRNFETDFREYAQERNDQMKDFIASQKSLEIRMGAVEKKILIATTVITGVFTLFKLPSFVTWIKTLL